MSAVVRIVAVCLKTMAGNAKVSNDWHNCCHLSDTMSAGALLHHAVRAVPKAKPHSHKNNNHRPLMAVEVCRMSMLIIVPTTSVRQARYDGFVAACLFAQCDKNFGAFG